MTNKLIRRNGGTTALPTKQFSSWVDQLFQDNLNHFFLMINGDSRALISK